MDFEFVAPKKFLNFRMEANPARIPPQPSMREISTGMFVFPVECREMVRHYLP